MEHNQNTYIYHLLRVIIEAPYGSNFVTILDLFVSHWKELAVVKSLFWQLGTRFSGRCRCRGVFLISPRRRNTVTGDETRLTSLQLISTYSLPTQPMKSCTTPPWSTPPTLYQQKFFYVKQESEQWRSYTCETGPKVYRPYPRRFRQKSLYGRPTETKKWPL